MNGFLLWNSIHFTNNNNRNKKVFLDDWKVLPPNEVAGLIYFQVIPIEYSLETQLSSENEKL